MILCIENSKEKKTTKTIRINRKVQQGYRIQDTYIKINCFLYCAVCVHRCSVMCQTLCNPMDCSPPDSLVQEDSLGNPLEWVAHALLQGIFPTQRSSPRLPHCSGFFISSELPGKPVFYTRNKQSENEIKNIIFLQQNC